MRSISLLHHKKKVREFPVPSEDVTTKLSLGGKNDVITELFLPRGSLVSNIPAGDGKLMNLFLRCIGDKKGKKSRSKRLLSETISIRCGRETGSLHLDEDLLSLHACPPPPTPPPPPTTHRSMHDYLQITFTPGSLSSGPNLCVPGVGGRGGGL